MVPGEGIKLWCTLLLKHSLGGQCLSILCDNVEGFVCEFKETLSRKKSKNKQSPLASASQERCTPPPPSMERFLRYEVQRCDYFWNTQQNFCEALPFKSSRCYMPNILFESINIVVGVL